MYQLRKNEGLERNFRGARTVFERCYKPGLILGVFLGLFWVIRGALRLPFFCARNGRFWVVDLQVDLQTGLAFFKNWTCKSG